MSTESETNPVTESRRALKKAGYDIKSIYATSKGIRVRIWGYGMGDDQSRIHRIVLAATGRAPNAIWFEGPRPAKGAKP